MAYADQSHYENPQYHRQGSHYAPPRPSRNANYEYAPTSNLKPQTQPPRRDLESPAQSGAYSTHGQDHRQDGYFGDTSYYAGSVQGEAGRIPTSGPRRRPTEAAQAGEDVGFQYDQAQASWNSRSAESTRFRPADAHYQGDHYREPQSYERQFLPGQRTHVSAGKHVNMAHETDQFSHGHHDGWRAERQHWPTSRADEEYWPAQHSMDHQRQEDFNLPTKQDPQDHSTDGSVYFHPQYNGTPRSEFGPPSDVKAGSPSSQRPQTSSSSAIEKNVSPNTLTWDNPFPTFPLRPKDRVHSSSKSVDGSSIAPSFKNKQQGRHNHDVRPLTASSTSSSYTIPQPPSLSEEHTGSAHAYHNGYHDGGQTQSRREGERLPSAAQGVLRPHNDYLLDGRSNPFEATGRPLENNRKFSPSDMDPIVNRTYGRSRTMPTAMSEMGMKSDANLLPALQTQLQEPGPVAGYFGPENRGFTPQSPTGTSQRRLDGPAQTRSNERRFYDNAAVQREDPKPYQQHSQQESFVDVFADYYEGVSQQHQESHIETNESQPNYHEDDDVPNFDAMVNQEGSHRRGLTIDSHLQPHKAARERPNPPKVPHMQYQQDQQRNNHINGPYTNKPVPRSRSQPNLKDRRSPRHHEANNGFDFGLPGPSRPPATATAEGNYRFTSENHPMITGPVKNAKGWERNTRDYGGPSPVSAESRRGHRNGPPSRGRTHAAYNANGPSDRLGTFPQDLQGNEPSPMASQAFARPNHFRPPLSQDRPPRQRPMIQPNGRSIPVTGDASSSIAYQNEGRSSPMQNVGSHVRTPGGRPLPIDRAKAVSPPLKSPVNPDALPSHPLPVPSSPNHRNDKPAPVRQYNSVPSPMGPAQKPGSSGSAESKQAIAPVSHQELDKLRGAIAKNPADQATQLLLAKKLVEAASILVDEQADSRTRSKGREKYSLEACKIVKKLSGNGYTEATFYLADCYTRGSLGLEADTREAFKLYQTAAKVGHAQAAYRVAVCCEIGQEEGGGTNRDPVKAMQWYKRAATLGDTPAMYKMGIIALKGLLGQPKNPKEAIIWLKRAAERADKENPHALHELGLLHEKPSGNDGIKQDEAYSMQLFTQAANLSYKFSQYRLGSAYEYGLMGCPIDPRLSIAWYSKAAVQEEHQSELALSGWYLTGSEGILQQSDTEAYLWARKAAQAGLAKAEYAMGYFTEVGIGAPADLEDAKRWYWRAASQNFPKARDRLEDLRKGGPAKRKERVSRSNVRKSSEGDCIVM